MTTHVCSNQKTKKTKNQKTKKKKIKKPKKTKNDPRSRTTWQMSMFFLFFCFFGFGVWYESIFFCFLGFALHGSFLQNTILRSCFESYTPYTHPSNLWLAMPLLPRACAAAMHMYIYIYIWYSPPLDPHYIKHFKPHIYIFIHIHRHDLWPHGRP